MKEYEFWLFKFYRRQDGWRASLFDWQNHENGAAWSLLSLSWWRQSGLVLECSRKDA